MLNFNFSVYNLLSILTFFIGFLYAFQIGTLKKTKSVEHKTFTWYLIVLSMLVFLFFLIDLHLDIKYLNLMIVLFVVPFVLLLAPLMWLYIRRLISYKKGTKAIFHFIPAIAVGASILILGTAFFMTKNPVLQSTLIQIMSFICIGSLIFVFLIQNIIYISLSIIGYRKHRRKMEHIYSYSEEVDLSWIRILIVGYIVFIVGMIAVNNISRKDKDRIASIKSYKGNLLVSTTKANDFESKDNLHLQGFADSTFNGDFKITRLNDTSFYIPKINYKGKVVAVKGAEIVSEDKKRGELSNILFSLIILFYIIYTGHSAMKQKSIAVSEPSDSNEPEPEYEKDKNISDAQLLVFQKIKEDLLHIMKTEKPYLDHNLNIFTLSKRLNTNSKYLSQIINQEFNKSFVHFVNEYRIEEAKQILLVNNNYTIEAQSQMVGFKSKSSFNIAFKRHTGLTPSLFIQGHR